MEVPNYNIMLIQNYCDNYSFGEHYIIMAKNENTGGIKMLAESVLHHTHEQQFSVVMQRIAVQWPRLYHFRTC